MDIRSVTAEQKAKLLGILQAQNKDVDTVLGKASEDVSKNVDSSTELDAYRAGLGVSTADLLTVLQAIKAEKAEQPQPAAQSPAPGAASPAAGAAPTAAGAAPAPGAAPPAAGAAPTAQPIPQEILEISKPLKKGETDVIKKQQLWFHSSLVGKTLGKLKIVAVADDKSSITVEALEEIKENEEAAKIDLTNVDGTKTDVVFKVKKSQPAPQNKQVDALDPVASEGKGTIKIPEKLKDSKFDVKKDDVIFDGKAKVTEFSADGKSVSFQVVKGQELKDKTYTVKIDTNGVKEDLNVPFKKEKATTGEEDPGTWRKWLGPLVGIGGGLLVAGTALAIKGKEEIGAFAAFGVGLLVAGFAALDKWLGFAGWFGPKKAT